MTTELQTQVRNIGSNLLQRITQAYRSTITWLNSIGLILMLYAVANPNAYEQALSFLPDGPVREVAKFIFPIVWFAVIQKGKEIDKTRTIVQERLAQ